MGLNAQNIVNHVVTGFIPLVVSLSLHEWGHAAAAVALGDNTPREQGRLTLNPVAHLDWFGSVLLPLVLLAFGVSPIGWARPVQISPQRFSRRVRLRTAVVLTAAAGPAMNLLLALIAAGVWAVCQGGLQQESGALVLLDHLLAINVLLVLLNLLPLPPLDGSRILRSLLPLHWRGWMPEAERYAPLLLGVFFFTGVGGGLLYRPTAALSYQLQQAAFSLLH